MITLQFATITRGEATAAEENYIKKKKKKLKSRIFRVRGYTHSCKRKSLRSAEWKKKSAENESGEGERKPAHTHGSLNARKYLALQYTHTRTYTYKTHTHSLRMKPPAYQAEETVQQQISQEQGERNVAMAVCVQLAGRAIIRVVSRCEEAQDNCNLGMYCQNVWLIQCV